MMLKIFSSKKVRIASLGLIGLVLISFSSILHAKGSYGAGGCGVGSVILGEKNDKSSQVFALLTNMTFGQIFSITTGTSNCHAGAKQAYLERRRVEFVAVHYSDLQKEMATGQGEKLEAFALLMGCETLTPFASMAQKNHAGLFAKPVKKALEFVNRVKVNMQANQKTARACNLGA